MKKTKKIALPILLSASVIGLVGCSTNSGETYVTSKAGNVTQKEVLDYIGSSQVAKSATDITIRKILLEKYKDKIDEKHIEKQLNDVQIQYGGASAFEAALSQQGYTLDKYKEALKVRTAQAYMINDFNGVTEDKIKEEYEKEKTQFNLAHILISVKSDTSTTGISDEEAKAKIEEIKKKLDAGEDFATLAKENSTDTSNAANGGELGWSAKGSTSFVTEFANAAYSLEKGKTSDIVKTSFGYHIIKVLDTKDLSYDELKAQLVEQLASKSVNADASVYSNALKKIFEEYDVKGSTSDVKSYIENMLSGKSSARN